MKKIKSTCSNLYIYHSFICLSTVDELYCLIITTLILLSLQRPHVLWVEVSNQQVVVRQLTSERDAIADSSPSLFHLELVRHLWVTALLSIIHLALGVWRSGLCVFHLRMCPVTFTLCVTSGLGQFVFVPEQVLKHLVSVYFPNVYDRSSCFWPAICQTLLALFAKDTQALPFCQTLPIA